MPVVPPPDARPPLAPQTSAAAPLQRPQAPHVIAEDEFYAAPRLLPQARPGMPRSLTEPQSAMAIANQIADRARVSFQPPAPGEFQLSASSLRTHAELADRRKSLHEYDVEIRVTVRTHAPAGAPARKPNV